MRKTTYENKTLEVMQSDYKKQLKMDVGSEEEQINLEQDATLHNTNKWTT